MGEASHNHPQQIMLCEIYSQTQVGHTQVELMHTGDRKAMMNHYTWVWSLPVHM